YSARTVLPQPLSPPFPTRRSSDLADANRNAPHPLRGYFFIASAALLWGVCAVLGRAVFTGTLLLHGEAVHPIDPIILSQTRTSLDRKSTRLNSSHGSISYAVFCLK